MVELADVRIIALGVLNKPRGSTTVNTTARDFLHPPGINKNNSDASEVGLPVGGRRSGPLDEATGKDGQKPVRQLFSAYEIQ